MYKITPPSSSTSMRSPTHVELALVKKGIKSDDPPQNVDIYLISVIPPAPPPIWMKYTFWIHHVTICFT